MRYLVFLFFSVGILSCEDPDPIHGCAFDGVMPQNVGKPDFCGNGMGFSSNEEAERIVKRIVGDVSLPQNFLVQECSGINNCIAMIDKGNPRTPRLLYDNRFLNQVKSAGFGEGALSVEGRDWAAIGVIAHEVAHHLSSHLLLSDPSRPHYELQADFFIGAALHRLGATLEQAQSCMHRYIPTEAASKTHPAKKNRLAEIEKGWSSVKNVPISPLTPPVDTPKPTPPTPARQSFEPEMVFVQGGTFQMGDEDEKPIHSVTLSNFSIGKYEVTQAQWRAVMGSDPSRFKSCDNCPVENVSWDNIQQYLSKLNSLTGKRYRLPTEAEWEYAARGGSNNSSYKYSGSDDLTTVAWYGGNSDNKTHSVGTKQANKLGIHDMSGNVWEWCQDWYGSYSSAAVSNPTGAATGASRVLRGCGWGYDPSDCRVAYRAGYPPTKGFSRYGFRVVSFP